MPYTSESQEFISIFFSEEEIIKEESTLSLNVLLFNKAVYILIKGSSVCEHQYKRVSHSPFIFQ